MMLVNRRSFLPVCYPKMGLDRLRRCAKLYVSMIQHTIAETIKHWRQVQGLSQRALAEKTGLSFVHIARLELAQGNPTIGTLERVADALEIPLVDLITGPPQAKRPARKRARGK